MIGKTISHYRIIERLGEGGMGVVYRAEDLDLQRSVALKFLHPTPGDPDSRRFRHEAQAAASLNHPNICTIYEIGEAGGEAYISMEYVAGRPLSEMVARGPMPLDRVLDIAIQVGEGLQEAHDRGIVHRDVKSANVMVTDKGRAVIMDFGLAKQKGQTSLTTAGTSVGTIATMSPEQAQGADVDRRTDIWALGVTLYEVIAGRLPFEGDRPEGVMYRVIHEDPQPLTAVRTGVPMALERIVTKAMAKRPEERYQSVADMLVDLRAVRSTAGASACAPAARAGRAWLSGAASRRVLGALAGYLILGVVVVLLVRWLVDRFPISPELPAFSGVLLGLLVPSVVVLVFPRGRASLRLLWIGIPANLVMAVIVLVLMFQGKELGATTEKVAVSDAQGRRIERTIPKRTFRKRIGLFYFENESGNKENDWIQYGISLLLADDLSQDIYLTLRMGFATRLSRAGYPAATGAPVAVREKIAVENGLPYYLSGSFATRGDTFTVRTTLRTSRNARPVARRSYTGTDLFALADTISSDLRRDVGVPAYHLEDTRDLPVADIVTRDTCALRRYVSGFTAWAFDNDRHAAIARIESAVEADPTFTYARVLLSLLYYVNLESDKMKDMARAALAQVDRLPEREAFAVRDLYFFFVRGDWGAAVENARMWMRLYPDDTGGYDRLAQLHTVRGAPEKAIELRRKILELDPDATEQLLEIADLRAGQGKFPEALRALEVYQDSHPDRAEAYRRLASLHAAFGHTEEAKENYRKALVLAPDDVETRMNLLRLEWKGPQFEQVLGKLREALRQAGSTDDSVKVLEQLADHLRMRGQDIAALEAFRQMLSLMERSSPIDAVMTRILSAEYYVAAGRRDEVFRTLRELDEIRSLPMVGPILELGYLWAYYCLDDPADEANARQHLASYQALIKAGEPEPFPGVVDFANGVIHRHHRQYAGAMVDLRKALQGVGKDLEEQILMITMECGRCALLSRNLGAAEGFYQDVLKREPYEPFGHLGLAKVYLRSHKETQAVTHLDNALYVWAAADSGHAGAAEARKLLGSLRPSL